MAIWRRNAPRRTIFIIQKVYDKNNNLVKSYFGERGVKGTKAYASGSIKDINLIASNAQHFNPEMQTLNTYTYNYLA